MVDTGREGCHIGRVDRREQRNPDLVPSQLAVRLGVDDAVASEHRRDVGRRDRVDEVDGRDDMAPPGVGSHERLGEVARFRPAVDRLRRLVTPSGGPFEAAVLVEADTGMYSLEWSRDGRYLIYRVGITNLF